MPPAKARESKRASLIDEATPFVGPGIIDILHPVTINGIRGFDRPVSATHGAPAASICDHLSEGHGTAAGAAALRQGQGLVWVMVISG